MNKTQTFNQTSVNEDVATEECPNETSADMNHNREAIDSVFTILGFEKCFLDDSHSPIKPNIRVRTKSAPLILHVDDDVDLVDAVTSRLAAAGYRVASALDGVSGMQEALRHPASAIILDYDMPNGRGDVVIDLLKSNERTKDIPIVVLTAVQQKSLKRTLLNKGADVFMNKPFEFAELQAVIASLLEGDDNE